MRKRYCNALSGLWERRRTHTETVHTIVDDALGEAERWREGVPPGSPFDTLWYGRLSADLRILEVSGPALREAGVSPEQAPGRQLDAFASEANAPIVREAAGRAIETGQTTDAFLRDSSGRMMVLHVRPVVRDGQQEVLCFAHFLPPLRLYQHEFQLVGET